MRSPGTDQSLVQASGNEVAALTSMPLMKMAATNVENVRKASPVIDCLLLRHARLRDDAASKGQSRGWQPGLDGGVLRFDEGRFVRRKP